MRATLADAALLRYAGRFVWLELDFDKPVNQPFLARHGVSFTPTLFVFDPANERATATKFGGLTLAELMQFLEWGERGIKEKSRFPADAALAQGDELMGNGRLAEAVAAYRDALRLAHPDWQERSRTVAALTKALSVNRDYQQCAETAVVEAPSMTRGPVFATVVLNGYGCAGAGREAPWALAAQKTLEPLAVEAVALMSILRDDRFQLYQQLMFVAKTQGDDATVKRWGELWLGEIESTTPANDNERSALDIARTDAASLMGDPARVIPALTASERAMSNNYNASLRLAEVLVDARRYDGALAACARGLRHVTGPLARSWILSIEGRALLGKGENTKARAVLEQALQSARTIGNKNLRDSNVRRITQAVADTNKKP